MNSTQHSKLSYRSELFTTRSNWTWGIRFVCFWMMALPSLAQPPDTLWTHLYGDSAMNAITRSAIQTLDGGYAAVGYVEFSEPQSPWYGFILKTGANGVVEWFRTYSIRDTSLSRVFTSIVVDPNGDMVIGGSIYIDHFNIPALLVKVNSVGDTLWTRLLNPDFNAWQAEVSSLVRTEDGAYIAMGFALNWSGSRLDAFASKTTSTGSLIWLRTYQHEQDHHIDLQSGCQAFENGYLLAGYSGSGFESREHAYALRIDQNGFRMWSREYSIVNDEYWVYGGVCPTPDNGFLMPTNTVFRGAVEGGLLRINSNGDTLWTKSYGDSTIDYIQPNPFGGYVCTLDSRPDVFDQSAVARLDSAGTIIWSAPIQVDDIDLRSAALIVTADSGYALWMQAYMFDTPFYANWMMCARFDQESLDIGTDFTMTPSTLYLGQNYPNPFNGSTTIPYQIAATGHVSLVLYNVLGQRVRAIFDGIRAPGNYTVNVAAEQLSSGKYMLRLRTPTANIVRSIEILK